MSRKGKLKPFNISILDTNSARVKNLRKVTSQAINEGATTQLHPEGIFSTIIFGRVGSRERNTTFGRIELKSPLLDPSIYTYLVKLKALYGDIMSGTKYARFDTELMDFVQAEPTNGDTGYGFFMKHWKKIKFAHNKSTRRSEYINLVEKNKSIAEISSLAVLPAGLRDIELNAQGRLEENEINEFYRRVLAYARLLEATDDGEQRLLDKPRLYCQRAIQDLWNYLFDLFGGKDGSFYRKATSRRLFDGTRNVISAMDTVQARLGQGGLTANSITVGLLQTAKGCRPLTIGIIRRLMTENVFDQDPTVTMANLIDPKTLKSVKVKVPTRIKESWLTLDGLGRTIESFREIAIRKEPIRIADHYLALVYEDEVGVKLFWSIDQLPATHNPDNVRPATLTDIFVIYCVREWEKRFSFPARYPIAGSGSTYPATYKVFSTVPSKVRKLMNDDWEVDENSHVFSSFPDYTATYYDSMSMHPSQLDGAKADHDGDMASNNYVLSDEAMAEMEAVLNSAEYYLSPTGGLNRTMDYYSLKLVTHSMNL